MIVKTDGSFAALISMPCPGYAVATYVLVVVLLVTGVLAVLAVLHYRRRNLSQEKALHTRYTDNPPPLYYVYQASQV